MFLTYPNLKELVVKKDFSDIYHKKFPAQYLKEMGDLEYRIADQTRPLYQHLAQRIVNRLKRPVKILDLGSSYGINSALLNYELVMSELDDFFLQNNHDISINEVQNFFEDLPNKNPNFEFYLVDISRPALEFATKVGLCNDAFCVNMEKDDIPSNFKRTINEIDLIISTGCIGYIGKKSFERLFDSLIKTGEKPLPVFAFSVLRMFPMDEIQEVFLNNNFSLVKTKVGPLRQRRFYNQEEQSKTINLLKDRNINTDGLEENGYFYANFFVGGPTKKKSTWIRWVKNLEDVFVPMKNST